MDVHEVMAAAARWVWIPEDAEHVETANLIMVKYPASFRYQYQVVWIAPDVRPRDVLRDIAVAAKTLATRQVLVWTGTLYSNELPAALEARNAMLVEEVAILACAPNEVLRDPQYPADRAVSVRSLESVKDLVDYSAISDRIFGGVTSFVESSDIDARLSAITDGWARGRGGEVIAVAEGTAIGIAGVTFAESDARLWGAAVIPEFRGKGVYRELLRFRLQAALDRGATLAIVKARNASSAPILLRSGFVSFGSERAYVLDPESAHP